MFLKLKNEFPSPFLLVLLLKIRGGRLVPVVISGPVSVLFGVWSISWDFSLAELPRRTPQTQGGAATKNSGTIRRRVGMQRRPPRRPDRTGIIALYCSGKQD
jgi:hypothetical protein